jgi:hypothetical protein
MVETLTISVLEEAMKLFSEKIARKLAEGKRITDTEVIILLLDQMNKRMDIMNESLNRRIDDTNKRIDELRESINERIAEIHKRIDDTNERINGLRDDMNRRIDELRGDMNRRVDELREDLRLLHQEVSSIKSDVINLLKEKIGRS